MESASVVQTIEKVTEVIFESKESIFDDYEAKSIRIKKENGEEILIILYGKNIKTGEVK